MKNLLVFASILLVSAAIVVSCSKDEQKINTPVTMVDGRLVFESQEAFENQIKYLFENQDNLDDFESQFKGFTSSRQAFDNFTEEMYLAANEDMSQFKDYAILLEKNGEQYMEPVIDAELLSYLANDKGILQIGDKIHKFTYEKVYIFDINQLPKFQTNGVNGLSNVKGLPIDRELGLLQKVDILECEKKYWSNSAGNRKWKRLVGEVSRLNAVAYSEVKVTTKHHSRKNENSGIWWREECGTLKQEGDVTYELTINNTTSHTQPCDKQKANQNHISKVLDFTLIANAKFKIKKADTKHEGTCNFNAKCGNKL